MLSNVEGTCKVKSRERSYDVKQRERRWVTDRDRKRIASLFPILVEMEQGPDYFEKHDGRVDLVEVLNRDNVRFRFVAVKRFDPETQVAASEEIQAFGVLARLDAIVQSGKEEIELPIVGESFRILADGLIPKDVLSNMGRWEKQDPATWAAFRLALAATPKLDAARLVIWRPRKGTIGPAIFCPNNEVAAYVSLALSRLFSGLRACLACGRIFVPARLDQDYHDRRCADLHRKRRQLKKQGKKP